MSVSVSREREREQEREEGLSQPPPPKKKKKLTGQHRDGGPRLPVPDPQGLVVARAQDPRARRVKLHRPDVVEVAQQREQAAAQLVRPDLDAIVVAARGEERLGGVEVDAADGAVVLVEAVDEGSHAVVPELVWRLGLRLGLRLRFGFAFGFAFEVEPRRG